MRRHLIVFCLLLASCTPTAESSSVDTQATNPAGVPVTVDAVLDGDSVRVTMNGSPVEVRLLGINAPERDECWADAARTSLNETLSHGAISLIGSEQDRYGRLLAYLYSDGTNVNRNQIIVGSALAIASDHEELPDFLAAEEEALALERGLWNPSACGAQGVTQVSIWAIEADAEGRDDRNPNGEFVAITNEGPAADLTDWTIHDESSVHRFTFPERFVLGTGDIIVIRSGCGDDDDANLYWCADGPVWTNSGDTVLLLDPTGAIADRVRYFDN